MCTLLSTRPLPGTRQGLSPAAAAPLRQHSAGVKRPDPSARKNLEFKSQLAAYQLSAMGEPLNPCGAHCPLWFRDPTAPSL